MSNNSVQPNQKQGAGTGDKFDGGKPELSLLPPDAMFLVLATLRTNNNIVGELKALRAVLRYCAGDKNAAYLMDAVYILALALGSDYEMLCGLADAMQYGKDKYSRNNWRGGFDDSRLLDATCRHLCAYICGERIDPESGRDHRHHSLFGIFVVIDQIERRKRGEDAGCDDIEATNAE